MQEQKIKTPFGRREVEGKNSRNANRFAVLNLFFLPS